MLQLVDKGVSIHCCGTPMAQVESHTSDGAKEKHLPQITETEVGVLVSVGSVQHPMTEEHSILWICLVTQRGIQIAWLEKDAPPEAVFSLAPGDVPVSAYCNLHGCWQANWEN